jgi:hypothetical protein
MQLKLPSQILILPTLAQSLAATSSVLNIKMVGTAVELEGVVVTALGIKNSVTSAGRKTKNLPKQRIQTWYNR